MSQLNYADTWDDYCAIKRMNASTLVHGLKSMWSLNLAIAGFKEPTPAMEFGSQYHQLILEPDEFRAKHVVMPDFKKDERNVDSKGKRSTSANTTWCRNAVRMFLQDARDEGKGVMKREDYDKAVSMIEGLGRNPYAVELIRDAEREVTLIGELCGIEVKGRLDLVGKAYFADIKGTVSVEEHAFGRSMANLNTAFKMAFYRELLRQNGSGRAADDAMLIAVESSGDFDTCVYGYSDIELDNALSDVKRTLQRYATCLDKNDWPGIQDNRRCAMPMFTPAWAMGESEELIFEEDGVEV